MHTSVIDAAGAIYVIGGVGRYPIVFTYYQDVWVSTDRGADRTCIGYSGVQLSWYKRDIMGTGRVLEGTQRLAKAAVHSQTHAHMRRVSALGVLEAHSRRTRGLLRGTC